MLFARSATDTIPLLIHISFIITTIVLTADILCGRTKMGNMLIRYLEEEKSFDG